MAGIPARKERAQERLVFLVGPTAAGKTEVAIRLARKINAEIISCDSMQVYKGMDILTSKPTLVLRKKTPHHLIDVLSPSKEYNVSRYCQEAGRKIREILSRGKVPLVVGGTGLYMSILLDGIFKVKSGNNSLRLKFMKEGERKGSLYLHRRLEAIDPEASAKIHPNDAKRIIRALEVFMITGRPISQLQKERRGLFQEYNVKVFCLNMERDKLYQRIEERVDKMFKRGLVREVKKLLGLRLSKTAGLAIGIREIKGYLDGLYNLEKARQLIKRNSCLYAKRQLTWFRKDKRIQWIEAKDTEKPGLIAKKIWNALYW